MDNETIKLLQDSRKTVAASLLIPMALLVAAFYVQVQIFSYLGFNKSEKNAHERLTQLEKQASIAKDMDTSVHALSNSAAEIDTLLQSAKEELKREFVRFNGSLQASLAENAAIGSDSGREQWRAQQSNVQQSNAPPFDRQDQVVNDNLIEQLKNAKNDEDFRNLLAPTIEADIIDPCFDRLNRDYQESIMPALVSGAGECKAQLEELKAVESSALSAELGVSLEAIVQEAQKLKFEPPPNQDWWSSVSSKDSTFDGISSSVAGHLIDVGRTGSLVKSIADGIASESREYTALRDKLAAEIENIQENLEALESNLSSVTSFSKFIAVDMEFIVRVWPLLLGCILSIVIAYPEMGPINHEQLVRALSVKYAGDAPALAVLEQFRRFQSTPIPLFWRRNLGVAWIVLAGGGQLWFADGRLWLGAAIVAGVFIAQSAYRFAVR